MRPINRTWEQFGGLCDRCGNPNDPYMVKHSLWKEVIPESERKSLICLECFETALGRELEYEDFIHKIGDKNLPINYGLFGFHVEDFLKSRGKEGESK